MNAFAGDFEVVVSRAMRLAQSGGIDEARGVIKSVRESFNVHADVDLFVDIQVIEGICLFYEGKTDLAYDKFVRSVAISSKLGNSQSKVLSYSWLSSCQINIGRHVSATESVLQALNWIGQANATARSRVAMEISMLFEYCGERSASVVWFNVARQEILKSQFPELSSALIYNVAMLRVGSRIINGIRGFPSGSDHADRIDLMFAKSSESYDELKATEIQGSLHKLVQGYANASIGNFAAAAASCKEFLCGARDAALVDFSRASICLAWSLACQGDHPGNIEELKEALCQLKDSDDLAFAHHALSQVHERLGNIDEASYHLSEKERYLVELDQVRGSVLGLLLGAKLDSLPNAWISE